MSNAANIEMGPCSITVGSTNVGTTVGRTLVTARPIWRPRRDERYGLSVADKIYLGCELSAAVTIAEKTLANLKLALPSALDGGAYLGLGRAPGTKLSSLAQQITLHPLEQSDTTADVVLHKAAAHGPVGLPFEAGKERTFRVEFVGLLDESKSNGELLGRIHQS